jgi:hypothetical protein
MQDYDYDSVGDLGKVLDEDLESMVDSISMPNAPSISENIATPNTLDLEIEVAQELLETQLTLN